MRLIVEMGEGAGCGLLAIMATHENGGASLKLQRRRQAFR